jgi:hypothetical protein
MNAEGLGKGIVGHATVLRILESRLSHPANGYVFFGVPHLGKRTVAERFVSALLGESYLVPRTSSCHPDLLVLEPEEGKTQVSVEQVRKARARLSERPMVAPRCVLFVPDANRMNEEGWNALLKVLEEPPAGAVFVFVSRDVTRFPATVMSRLTAIPFSAVPAAEIASGLMERGLSKADAEHRAKECRGRPGLAIEPEERDETEVKRFLIAKKLGERLAIVESLASRCEAEDRPVDAWIASLETWAEVCRRSLPHLLKTALAASEGVTVARRFAGGPLSPRLALEAAAIRMSSSRPVEGLFPSHLPTPIPSLFCIQTV